MASDINSVTIVGRLTRDVEMKYSASGTAVARFSIANTQSRKDGENWVEEGHFFDAVMFGRRADALQRYLVKGKQIVILGRLQQDRWQDKQSGQNRSRVTIVVNDIQLVGGRSDGHQMPVASDPAMESSATPGAVPDNTFDDDIPF